MRYEDRDTRERERERDAWKGKKGMKFGLVIGVNDGLVDGEGERKEKRRDEKGEDRNWRTRRRRRRIAGNVTHVYIYMHLFICNTRVCVRMHDEYIRGVSLALLRLITT